MIATLAAPGKGGGMKVEVTKEGRGGVGLSVYYRERNGVSTVSISTVCYSSNFPISSAFTQHFYVKRVSVVLQ